MQNINPNAVMLYGMIIPVIIVFLLCLRGIITYYRHHLRTGIKSDLYLSVSLLIIGLAFYIHILLQEQPVNRYVQKVKLEIKQVF